MNLHERKLVLIEEFLNIRDESLIAKLESIIRQEKKVIQERHLNPMSLDDFHEMIAKAQKDREEGRVISHQNLIRKIKTWK